MILYLQNLKRKNTTKLSVVTEQFSAHGFLRVLAASISLLLAMPLAAQETANQTVPETDGEPILQIAEEISEDAEDDYILLAAAELEKGNLSSIVLEKLIHDSSIVLSEELREELVLAVYSSRGDCGSLADQLRKEASR